MRIERFPEGTEAAAVRALTAIPAEVGDDVRYMLERVRAEGDSAVAELTARLDNADLGDGGLRVDPADIDAAGAALDPAVREALAVAISNVTRAAEAQRGEGRRLELPAGQVVDVAELPVRRAAAYVPGGRAPYPSTLVMCAATARAAGVDELAVSAPPGRRWQAAPPDPGRLLAARRGRGLPDGRGPGHRRAGIRHRDDRGRRRGGGPGQQLRAGGQAAACRDDRDRRRGRPERARGGGHRISGSAAARAGPPGAGRARPGQPGGPDHS